MLLHTGRFAVIIRLYKFINIVYNSSINLTVKRRKEWNI